MCLRKASAIGRVARVENDIRLDLTVPNVRAVASGIPAGDSADIWVLLVIEGRPDRAVSGEVYGDGG